MAKSKSSMDSLPPQDIMDIIASVVLFPKPSNVLNPKRNSIEYFIHITERITKSSYHGIVGGCVFCGHNRKWTAAQIRIHFTKEKEGATHVHECPKVPPQITRYYREIRDAFVSQQEQKSGRNVALLRKEMLQVQSPDSAPSSQSSQPGPDSAGSTPKRQRVIDDSQPTIRQAFVSKLFVC